MMRPRAALAAGRHRRLLLTVGLALCALAAIQCDGGPTTPAAPSPATPLPAGTAPASATADVLLGRPTDSTVAASVRVNTDMDVYLDYGTAPGAYAGQTPASRFTASTPGVIDLTGLRSDTAYYYRVRYRPSAEATFRTGDERTFHTARLPGSAFTFVVQADPHLDGNSSVSVYEQTMRNQLADHPDFLVDLGDTSMVEKCVIAGSDRCAAPAPATPASVSARYALMRTYFEQVGHSVPVFLALGNHDGEAGWLGDGAAGTVDAWSVAARKAFFPNPEPGAFFSGNVEETPGIGLRQNYYAFEWGDALFVVLDPFTYTKRKPGGDGWGWTLGAAQYQWLARTLQASRARFKFVFSHHLLGGNGSENRGGTAFASLFEWGGRNLDGSWGFDRQRPGWPAPVHQLFVNARVTAWFHGHDHLYAREQLDGVVYQEVPQPSLARYDMPDPGAGYGYQGANGVNIFPSSGHLRVTVDATAVRVDYVRSVAASDETPTRRNATIVHSYTIR